MGLDVSDHGVDGFVEGEIGGVEFDGVVGAGERADGAHLVAHVALEDSLKDILKFDGNAVGGELRDAAAGAFFRVGVQIEFELGMGENDGPLVAPFGDEGTGRLADETLLADEFFADPGVVGGDVCDFRDPGLADGVGDVSTI